MYNQRLAVIRVLNNSLHRLHSYIVHLIRKHDKFFGLLIYCASGPMIMIVSLDAKRVPSTTRQIQSTTARRGREWGLPHHQDQER